MNISDKTIRALIDSGEMKFLPPPDKDQMPDKPYRGKYQGQKGATVSRVYLDREGRSND